MIRAVGESNVDVENYIILLVGGLDTEIFPPAAGYPLLCSIKNESKIKILVAGSKVSGRFK